MAPNPPSPPRALPTDDVALLEQASHGSRQLSDEIGKVIVGQHDAVRALLAATLAEGHVLLVGVPGLAKTLLVKTLAGVLGWKFHRIQFTPDMMPADIIGMELLQDAPTPGTTPAPAPGSNPGSNPESAAVSDPGGGRRMRFVPGPVFANIVLADEINRTPPKTQSALLEAMQEQTVTSMGKTHPLEKPFIVVATQNPIEQEGTYPLPEAQLDRFMFSLWLDYPTVEQEEQIVMETTSPREVGLSPVFTKEQMIAFQALVRRMPVTRHAVSYAVAIARATRPGTEASSDVAREYVEWGAGPRAGQHMTLAAKALAVIDGEPTVSTRHIRQAAPLVLRHRVLPNYQAIGEGLTSASLVERIVKEIAEPTYA